jgi:D-hexose-6-phosphate mutarotase
MNSLKQHEIPGRVTFHTGQGGLPLLRVETAWSTAEIYPLGAHLTHFQKKGEEPLLFMSAASEFAVGKPIRGGVPLIFPWFGGREGMPAHGFARQTVWDLIATRELPDGSVTLHFRLPPDDEFEVDFTVTIGRALTMELAVRNTGHSDFSFENCLHTYFHVRTIGRCTLTGLLGTRYRDQLLATDFTETAEALRITGETDRIYQDTAATVVIQDPEIRRSIHVRKSGSKSTVVWNPWIEKSNRMPDFGDTEYLHMVCVESGNVRENAITLAPGECSSLTVEIDSTPLA